VLVSEEPPGGLGSVACVGILGEDGDQAALKTEVEGGEEDRKCRLRDASPGTLAVGGLHREALVGCCEVVGERLEALAVGEFSSDDV